MDRFQLVSDGDADPDEPVGLLLPELGIATGGAVRAVCSPTDTNHAR
ncbi:hypothetical protein ONA91_33670 [Micromonospora sp. DR5-3]|nr:MULTISPECIES: hypothetical protein [unclassified Micromonospora]MCW3819404.1 hypothetical protein [Micromonospora sp. DR5-3]